MPVSRAAERACTGVFVESHRSVRRHTYASWLIQDSVPLEEVGRLLGHVSPLTTRWYAHLAETPSDSVLSALSRPERWADGGKTSLRSTPMCSSSDPAEPADSPHGGWDARRSTPIHAKAPQSALAHCQSEGRGFEPNGAHRLLHAGFSSEGRGFEPHGAHLSCCSDPVV
ncbi:tyrosine-type recombinase/integrase [Curtobacterium sp. KT1]|uniref:tyrosine-type recombinase/integrase n=1 Tax=Curtobacterium sp. KT1 TaxID=3372858 RepID=UPI0037BED1EF